MFHSLITCSKRLTGYSNIIIGEFRLAVLVGDYILVKNVHDGGKLRLLPCWNFAYKPTNLQVQLDVFLAYLIDGDSLGLRNQKTISVADTFLLEVIQRSNVWIRTTYSSHI